MLSMSYHLTPISWRSYFQGKGLFELVDYYFASSFQNLYDEFVRSVSNFIQVGRCHRFWTDMDGKLSVMVVTPQQPSHHPEWRDLFDQFLPSIQQQFLSMRHFGRRIGYFITDIRKGSRVVGPGLIFQALINDLSAQM